MSELFKTVFPKDLNNEVSVSVCEGLDAQYPSVYIRIKDTDENGPTFLDVNEARALRDWLNKALPSSAEESRNDS